MCSLAHSDHKHPHPCMFSLVGIAGTVSLRLRACDHCYCSLRKSYAMQSPSDRNQIDRGELRGETCSAAMISYCLYMKFDLVDAQL